MQGRKIPPPPAAVPTRDGVCRFFETEVVAARNRKRILGRAGTAASVEWWNPPDGSSRSAARGFERQPWLFMALADGAGCPPLDSPRYAHAENVSDGLFKATGAIAGAMPGIGGPP